MKKLLYIVIALVIFAVPILARTLWFYQGINNHRSLQTPDFAGITVATPVRSTPISQLTPEEKLNTRVLIDYSHSNLFTPSEIEVITRTLTNSGVDVRFTDYNTYLDEALKSVDCYLIIAPTYSFSSYELSAIQTFVAKGGRLLIFADPTRNSYSYDYYSSSSLTLTSVDILNQITSQYGTTLHNDYAYNLTHNEGNFRNIYAIPSSDSSLTSGMVQIVLYSALSMTSEGDMLLSGSEDTLSSKTDLGGGLVFAALSQNDQVLVLGDMTFLEQPYLSVADNQLLLRSIVEFAGAGSRSIELSDFPFIILDQAVIYLSTDLTMDSELLTSITSLQGLYRNNGIDIQVGGEMQQEKDMIILGWYPPAEDISSYIDPFEIDFTGSGEAEFVEILPTETATPEGLPDLTATETPYFDEYSFNYYDYSGEMTVPGLGSIPNTGMGLLLHVQNGDQNILILLADTTENLVALINTISYGDLSTCLVNKNTAACPVNSYSSYSGY